MTAARSSPGRDFSPVPDERRPQRCDRFGEVVVALSPDVDDLGAADAEAFGDLVCPDQVGWIDKVSHIAKLTIGARGGGDVACPC